MASQMQVVIIEAWKALTPADKGALTRLLKTSTVPKAFAVVGSEDGMASLLTYLDSKGQVSKAVMAGNSKKVAQLAEALITFDATSTCYAWAKKRSLPCYVRKAQLELLRLGELVTDDDPRAQLIKA
jgi:hypothetical protein